jgi:hypothetical protein
MPNKIERLSAVGSTITATNSTSTSPRIPFGANAGGMVFVTGVATATKILWHAALTNESTPIPVHADGAAVETAVANNRAYPIPDACFAAPFLVAVTDAGTLTLTIAVKG